MVSSGDIKLSHLFQSSPVTMKEVLPCDSAASALTPLFKDLCPVQRCLWFDEIIKRKHVFLDVKCGKLGKCEGRGQLIGNRAWHVLSM